MPTITNTLTDANGNYVVQILMDDGVTVAQYVYDTSQPGFTTAAAQTEALAESGVTLQDGGPNASIADSTMTETG